MDDLRRWRVRSMLILVLATSTVLVWGLPYAVNLSQGGGEYLTVSFLDVGQGDSILITSPDGVRALIDGGPDSAVLRELGERMGFFNRRLDVVLATHPDLDHIGGLVDVLKRYLVTLVIQTESQNETNVARAYAKAVNNSNAEVLFARRGQRIFLGADTVLEVLFPEYHALYKDPNTASIVVRVVYGDTAFMLTGDAPLVIEEYLVATEPTEGLRSEVLKVGHHGSRTSTAENFVATVSPVYGVISAGFNNRFGHPHEEVVETLLNAEVEILNTADLGTITFYSDGRNVWREEDREKFFVKWLDKIKLNISNKLH